MEIFLMLILVTVQMVRNYRRSTTGRAYVASVIGMSETIDEAQLEGLM